MDANRLPSVELLRSKHQSHQHAQKESCSDIEDHRGGGGRGSGECCPNIIKIVGGSVCGGGGGGGQNSGRQKEAEMLPLC